MDGTDGGFAERAMTPAEAEAAMNLVVDAGWNQTADDWRLMLSIGRGFGLTGPSGQWIASSLALPLGSTLSWISMVLVLREFRKQGLGTRLLRRCIESIRADGAVAGLDATELGRPVYLKLGFKDLYAISRWKFASAETLEAPPAGCQIRQFELDDLPALIAYDEPRSAMRRKRILRDLSARAPDLAFVAESGGRIAGYAMGRPGRMATQIGPLVADDEEIAVALMTRARAAARAPTIIDVPEAHSTVRLRLEADGAVRQRGFVRMVLGDPPPRLDDPSSIFALAGPELG